MWATCRWSRYAAQAAGLAAIAGLVVGCSAGPDLDTPEADTVTILAAASLTDVLPDLVELASAEHPDRTYEVSYAGSAQIVQQLNAGAPVDAVILAGQAPLATLAPDLQVAGPRVVATNSVLIALAPGNPGEVSSLDDLTREDVTLVVCAEQVPCGQAATEVFDAAGLAPRVASYEPDVRAARSKVASGEADAALVYRTDVADGELPTVEVPADVAAINRYPAFSVGNSTIGEAFVDLLVSDAGQGVLEHAGFGAP